MIRGFDDFVDTLLALTMAICILVTFSACSSVDSQNGAGRISDYPVQAEASGQIDTSIATSSSEGDTPFDNSDKTAGDGDSSSESSTTADVSGLVTVTFSYLKQSGSASNQFAVWVEDLDGNYLQTVYVTRWTAKGGFKTRPDSIALWVQKSELASLPSYYVDAVSGATPQTGEITCVWDLTDIDGNTVPNGRYRVLLEGTLRWKNYVLCSGVVEVGESPDTVQADPEYVYAGSGNQAALTENSAENAMIGAVTVSYTKE